MKKAVVSVTQRRKFKITKDSKHNFPVASNLLNRDFQAHRPNAVCCSDITYLWTMEGWLFLAVIIDLYSRKVIGCSICHRMKASLVIEALLVAYWRRKPSKKLIFRSDPGSQYAGDDRRQLLCIYGMTSRMSGKVDC
jgi:transposase InsO family protein